MDSCAPIGMRGADRDARPDTDRYSDRAGPTAADRVHGAAAIEAWRSKRRRLHLRLASLVGDRYCGYGPGYWQQPAQAKHGTLASRARREDRDRGWPDRHRRATAPKNGPAEEAEETT